MPLPSWCKNQYLVVSRVLTTGTYQENVLCEANICAPAFLNTTSSLTACSEDDILHLGRTMDLRCATPPIRLNVPPTLAKKCKGEYEAYVDIPGFHDPRIFWSGKGEPLMIMGSQYVSYPILCSPPVLLGALSVQPSSPPQISIRLFRTLDPRSPHPLPTPPTPPLPNPWPPTHPRPAHRLPQPHRTNPQPALLPLRVREKLAPLLPTRFGQNIHPAQPQSLPRPHPGPNARERLHNAQPHGSARGELSRRPRPPRSA